MSRKILASIAKMIKLDKQILLSENEESSNGRYKESIIADAFEAFISAIYLDKGINFLTQWFLDKFEDIIEKNARSSKIFDYKTYLQEAVQADYGKLVNYKIEKSEGPDHKKVFYSLVLLDNKIIGQGSGQRKKDSEQAAAKNALASFYNLNV